MNYTQAKKTALNNLMQKQYTDDIKIITVGIGKDFQPYYKYDYNGKIFESEEELYNNGLMYFFTEITKSKRFVIEVTK